MEPKVIDVSSFSVSGLKTRTTNFAELNKDTAKISGLWGQFYSMELAGNIPNRVPDTPILGVYSAYESDATGAYNLTIGVQVRPPVSSIFENVDVQEGKYIVFEAMGPMPAAIIQTWSAIWRYFELNLRVRRNYQTDFESWSGPEEVKIYIGVEAY